MKNGQIAIEDIINACCENCRYYESNFDTLYMQYERVCWKLRKEFKQINPKRYFCKHFKKTIDKSKKP